MANELPAVGFVRVAQIVGRPATGRHKAIPAILPISKSAWWAGVHSGKYPPPIKLGPGTTVWPVDAIRDLIARLGEEGAK